jgi:diguanylate cyclase (GGDEF)-like protein
MGQFGGVQLRFRLSVWGIVACVALADAAIATPLGLSQLFFLPIVLGAIRLPLAEALSMAVVSAAARVLFGPVGDPLGIHASTFSVPEGLQLGLNAATSLAAFVVTIGIARYVARQRRDLLSLRSQTRTDPLTQVGNRRALELTLALHQGASASVLMVDADHFKAVNDSRGHEVGDKVLIEMARRFKSCVRAVDLVARTGGEEFVIVLLEAPAEVGARIAQRIVDSVRAEPFEVGGGSPLQATVSVGVATGPLGSQLLERGDRALYDAKAAGRDRVVAG